MPPTAALVANLLRYALLGSGPLTTVVFEITGTVRTEPGPVRPDGQLASAPYRRNLRARGSRSNRSRGRSAPVT